MDTYRSDEEQIEALKSWWNDNGKAVIDAIVIGISGSLGWQWWQARAIEQANLASELYQELMEVSQQEVQTDRTRASIDELAATLATEFAGSGYTHLAALLQAKHWVNQGRVDEALASLQGIEQAVAQDPSLYALTKLRRARLQASMGQVDSALTALESLRGTEFAQAAAIAELDIYLSQEKYQEAERALNRALVLAPQDIDQRELEAKRQFIESRVTSTDATAESSL